MSCKSCKDKKKNVLPKNINKIEKYSILFFIGWSILGVYGLYEIITKIF